MKGNSTKFYSINVPVVVGYFFDPQNPKTPLIIIMINFAAYFGLSSVLTAAIVYEAVELRTNLFYTSIFIFSTKAKMLILLNFFIAFLLLCYSAMVIVFFSEIRSIEKRVSFGLFRKYVQEKLIRKGFNLLLIFMMYGSNFDIYIFICLSI